MTLKIQTKNEAIDLLDHLLIRLSETIRFVPNWDIRFYNEAHTQIIYMKNSINHSDEFFNNFFKDKTKEEVIAWIESESKKWSW